VATLQEFREEVESGIFPATEHSTAMEAQQLEGFKRLLEENDG
jgi:hypothetical protein